jgi:hypothetical protein
MFTAVIIFQQCSDFLPNIPIPSHKIQQWQRNEMGNEYQTFRTGGNYKKKSGCLVYFNTISMFKEYNLKSGKLFKNCSAC